MRTPLPPSPPPLLMCHVPGQALWSYCLEKLTWFWGRERWSEYTSSLTNEKGVVIRLCHRSGTRNSELPTGVEPRNARISWVHLTATGLFIFVQATLWGQDILAKCSSLMLLAWLISSREDGRPAIALGGMAGPTWTITTSPRLQWKDWKVMSVLSGTNTKRMIQAPMGTEILTRSLQEWSISNFSCSQTRNITSHSMKNLAFHSLLRWEMIILPILTTSLIHLSLKRLGECTFWTWEWKG